MRGMTASRAHHPTESPELIAHPYNHADVQELVRALYAEQLQRYDSADPPEAAPTDYQPPRGLFLVGYTGQRAVACGGCRFHDADTAEIKKMYVRPELRGHGYGRTILTALETWAADAGAHRIILETGQHNTEAIACYTHAGYQRIPGYSAYGSRPQNRAFARTMNHEC